MRVYDKLFLREGNRGKLLFDLLPEPCSIRFCSSQERIDRVVLILLHHRDKLNKNNSKVPRRIDVLGRQLRSKEKGMNGRKEKGQDGLMESEGDLRHEGGTQNGSAFCLDHQTRVLNHLKPHSRNETPVLRRCGR